MNDGDLVAGDAADKLWSTVVSGSPEAIAELARRLRPAGGVELLESLPEEGAPAKHFDSALALIDEAAGGVPSFVLDLLWALWRRVDQFEDGHRGILACADEVGGGL